MSGLWNRIASEVGILGLIALALIGGATAFHSYRVKTLEETNRRLDLELARLDRQGQRGAAPRADLIRSATPAAALTAFYAYFDRPERSTDWLAKLHGVATATGVQMRSADYRTTDTSGDTRADARQRLERTRISLPVSGGYTQIQAFMEGALAEIPLLSLDQVKFRRSRATDPRIEAELVFSLHELKR